MSDSHEEHQKTGRLKDRLLVSVFPYLFVSLVLAGFWLPQLVRDEPLVLLFGLLRIDGLGAFFVLLALIGANIALVRGEQPRPLVLVAALVVLAYVAEPLGLVALGLAAAALAAQITEEKAKGEGAVPHLFKLRPLVSQLKRKIPSLPSMLSHLSPIVLLIAAFLLRQSGSWRYSSPLAGAGLSSASFALVLAAVLLGVFAQTVPGRRPSRALLLAPAWAYPLARLYSYGSWNNGWHVAALLLCGTLMVWAAVGSLSAQAQVWPAQVLRSSLAAALLCLSLGSSAGLAAGSYALLSYLVVASPLSLRTSWPNDASSVSPRRHGDTEDGVGGLFRPSYASGSAVRRWLLTAAVPLTMPFVATWMGVGAAVASATPATALAIWLASLLIGFKLALRPAATGGPGWILGGLSLAAGVLSPLVVQLLILPLVEQLQGGLSPFGELEIWPWVGLAMLDSQRRQVATLPSLVVGGLLLVLMAIVHLLAWLLPPVAAAPTPTAAPNAGDDTPLWELVRREVFWLRGRGRGE